MKYFDANASIDNTVDSWRWWVRGDSPPSGNWWIRGRTSDQLRVSFSGDKEGQLPTTSIGLTRSSQISGIQLSLEFSIYMSIGEIHKFKTQLEIACGWLDQRKSSGIVFQDYYRAENSFSGGAIVLAPVANLNKVAVLIWSRAEEYELRYDLSENAVRALHEMTQFAIDWLDNPEDEPQAGGDE